MSGSFLAEIISLAELGFFVLFLLTLNNADKTNQKKRYSPEEEHSVHRLSRPPIIVRSYGEIKQNNSHRISGRKGAWSLFSKRRGGSERKRALEGGSQVPLQG